MLTGVTSLGLVLETQGLCEVASVEEDGGHQREERRSAPAARVWEELRLSPLSTWLSSGYV